MHGSINKSPIKLSMQWKINWHDDLFTNGKNLHGKKKPHWVILRSLLSRIHYYQNKQLQIKESQYLILTCNWTLTPVPNWTCSVVTISPFQCTALSTWLTNCADPNTRLDHQLEKDVGCKVLQFIQMMKFMKLLGHKTLWCTNMTASSRTRAN